MKHSIARIQAEMQRRGFQDHFPAMAIWPFERRTVPRTAGHDSVRGQSRRTLLLKLAQEGKISLLDQGKRPIDAHHYQWVASADDKVFVEASDLETVVAALLDAPGVAEAARRQAERQKRADMLRRIRSIPPHARRLIRRNPILDRKTVTAMLDMGMNSTAIQNAVALLGQKLPSSFDRVVDDWRIHQAKRLHQETGFVRPGMGKFVTSLTSDQKTRQRQKANVAKITEWASQRPTTTAELRAHLEEFLTLDVPRLGRRKQVVAERLKQQASAPYTDEQRREAMDKRHRKLLRRPNESDLARRAAANGDDKTALQYARCYHNNVKPLYRSQYANIDYGPGGVEKVCWPYSKSYGYPAKYKNAGVRIAYDTMLLIIEDSRAKVVAEVSITLAKGKLVRIGDRECIET